MQTTTNKQALAFLKEEGIWYADLLQFLEQGLDTNENINMLIRNFIPMQNDFNKFTRSEIKHVHKLLNQRPRKHWIGLLLKSGFKN
jgi:IS30 family transposase